MNEFEKAVDEVYRILSDGQKKWYEKRNELFGWKSEAEQYDQDQCDSAKSDEQKELAKQQYESKK